MRQKTITLIFLIITLLLATACGTKAKSLPADPKPDEISAFIHDSFPIPDEFKANSKLNWTATNATGSAGLLTINLVAPDPAKLDTNALVQGFLDRAKTINKEGKVSIDNLDIQLRDSNQAPLMLVSYVKTEQGFDGTAWSAEGITPLQGVVQDPNLTYPIQPIVPALEPTTYP